MSKPIQMDNTTRVLNQMGGLSAYYASILVVPIVGLVRVCYNGPSLVNGIFRFFVPSNATLSGKDIAIAAAGQMGRGVMEFIPVVGIIGSAFLNSRNDNQLIEQAKRFIDNDQMDFALETLAQASNTGEAFSAVDSHLIGAKQQDKCAELYLTLAQKNEKFRVSDLNVWPIVRLAEHFTDQATPESIATARHLVNVIVQWGGARVDVLGHCPAKEANDYINERVKFAEKYAVKPPITDSAIVVDNMQLPD